MFNNQYGGGGGGGGHDYATGGGFDASTNAASSTQQGGAGTKTRGNQTLTPITIRQYLNASLEDSKLMIDGKEVGQLCLIGLIMDQDQKQTHKQYKIEDGTGEIKVRIYHDMEDAANMGGMYICFCIYMCMLSASVS
jgi:replication factor A2